MKTIPVRRYAVNFSLLLIGWSVSCVTVGYSQQSETADQIFPATTAMYLEVANPPELVDAILSHPLRDRIEGMDQVQQLLQSPQYAIAMMGKTFLEKQLGRSWDDAIREVTAEGLSVGFDLKTQGIAVMFKAKDEATLKKTAEVFLDLTKVAAQGNGDKAPFEIQPYRNAKFADFGDFLVARMGVWFLISNNKQLAKQIADNMEASPRKSLAAEPWYQAARENRADDSIWSAVHLEVIREAGVAKDLFAGSVDNPGVELLFGGILDGLENAAFASSNVRLDKSLQFDLELPFNEKWASSTREFFYGSGLSGRAPAAVELGNSIASFSVYRDLSAWWLAKEDLFSEGVIAQMAEFDSQVSTLLAGLDFGEEFLGGLEPGAQMIVAEHGVETESQPDVKLPGFALVGQLKDQGMTRKIRVAYKNMIGILNLNLGMDGQAQLDATSEKLDGINLTSTEYMIEDDAEDGLLVYNFSPSIAFVDQQMVLASTRGLCLQIAEKLRAQGVPAKSDSNMRLEVKGDQLHQVLLINREPLVANNMIEEGNSRAEAGTQIDALLLIAELLESASVDFRVQPERMKLDIQVNFEE